MAFMKQFLDGSDRGVYRSAFFQNHRRSGSSITAMNRWVKPLQRRLFDAYGGDYALMNAGNRGGNCLLFMISRSDGRFYGEKGANRFERCNSVFRTLRRDFGVEVNDVAYYSKKTGAVISLEQYGSAVTDIVDRLYKAGVRVIAQTLPAPQRFCRKRVYPEMEALRVKASMNGSEIARCSIIWLMRMHCCAIRRILRSPTSVIIRGPPAPESGREEQSWRRRMIWVCWDREAWAWGKKYFTLSFDDDWSRTAKRVIQLMRQYGPKAKPLTNAGLLGTHGEEKGLNLLQDCPEGRKAQVAIFLYVQHKPESHRTRCARSMREWRLPPMVSGMNRWGLSARMKCAYRWMRTRPR